MFPRLRIASRRKCFVRGYKRLSGIRVDDFNHEYVTVSLDESRPVSFSTTFLRDACQGKGSVDPHSGQKLFTTAQVTKDISILGSPVVKWDPATKEEQLRLDWHQNGEVHTSYYSKAFLRRYMTFENRFKDRFFYGDRIEWDRSKIFAALDRLVVDYKSYLNGEKGLYDSVKNLNEYGIAIVKNIPDPVESLKMTQMNESNALEWPVAKLATKFGYIKKTFYGTLFDVKNTKEATNIAYTKSFLPLHMDLLYYESPPGVQLLHFIRNSTEGGENIFCDSFLAAMHVREKDPQAYYALKTIPISYHYDKGREYYYYSRPLVVEDDFTSDQHTGLPQIKEVNYSPPFQAPFDFGIVRSPSDLDEDPTGSTKENFHDSLFKDFNRGLQLFESFISDPQNQYLVKFNEGDCVLFDNRRVLHSRLEFSDTNGGDRWLMGTYVDGDSYRSRLRMAYRKR